MLPEASRFENMAIIVHAHALQVGLQHRARQFYAMLLEEANTRRDAVRRPRN